MAPTTEIVEWNKEEQREVEPIIRIERQKRREGRLKFTEREKEKIKEASKRIAEIRRRIEEIKERIKRLKLRRKRR